jgi:hypothetical protein
MTFPGGSDGFQHSANRGRGNAQLLSDLCHGHTFRVEAGQFVRVYDQARPSADPPLLGGLIVIAMKFWGLMPVKGR